MTKADGGTAPHANRDVVVIGASAGGVVAVAQLARMLPPDLPAAVLVVVHRGVGKPAYLAEILDGIGTLRAVLAEEGMKLEPGRIYTAPSDRHLLVGKDHLHVRRGPRENRVRPAVDPLFRSAAVNCTTRVIGVVLTGMLDDGTAGLLAVKRCGGLALVQDPSEAAFDQMPRSALAHVAVDHVASLAGLAGLLPELVRAPCSPPIEPSERLRIEALIAAQELIVEPDKNPLGKLAPLTCPECHGAMYEIDDDFLRYRCHTGHAFTAKALRSAQSESWERALYDALRVQEEQGALVRRMALEARLRGRLGDADDYERRAVSYDEGAQIIRQMLARGPSLANDSHDAIISGSSEG